MKYKIQILSILGLFSCGYLHAEETQSVLDESVSDKAILQEVVEVDEQLAIQDAEEEQSPWEEEKNTPFKNVVNFINTHKMALLIGIPTAVVSVKLFQIWRFYQKLNQENPNLDYLDTIREANRLLDQFAPLREKRDNNTLTEEEKEELNGLREEILRLGKLHRLAVLKSWFDKDYQNKLSEKYDLSMLANETTNFLARLQEMNLL